MRPRMETLKRLVSLYGVVEEMRSAELQRTMAAVHEAQQAIRVQEQCLLSGRLDGRDALTTGDRMGWTMAEKQQETAGWKRSRLQQICLEREVLSDRATEQYLESRVKNEQMKSVAENMAAQQKTEEERRIQAASDDRYLARSRWSGARDRTRAEQKLNVS